MDGQSNGLHALEHLVVMATQRLRQSGCSLSLIGFFLPLLSIEAIDMNAEGGKAARGARRELKKKQNRSGYIRTSREE